ncbi:hypothetical protein Elgi_31480 [Paenibacillus elgii]|nr:hypothetical protein Elgi_31480 [Paenibacillus elgii]
MRVLKDQKLYFSSNQNQHNTFNQQHMQQCTLIGLTGLSY